MIRLFVSDIDNTLIPQLVSQDEVALQEFSQQLAQHDIVLAYASGRHMQLVLDSIAHDNLPAPQYIISNVGTTIHEHIDGSWEIDTGYDALLAQEWHNYRGIQVHEFIKDVDGLKRQEEEVQFDFKQSYYVDLAIKEQEIVKAIQQRLQAHAIASKVLYSVDQVKQVGLVDVLPARSGKDGAMIYLADKLQLRINDIIFAGDSGNDITALTSGVRGILVANAREAVKQELHKQLSAKHLEEQVYFARSNYLAGVMEGLRQYGFFK